MFLLPFGVEVGSFGRGSPLPLQRESTMKITLAICTNRGVRPKTVGCLLEMVAHSNQLDWHILIAEKGYTIAENRNYAVIQAKKNGSDYLLFVDDDMTFPPETAEKLLALGRHVVGVKSYSRLIPTTPTVGLMDESGNYKSPDKYPSWELKIPEESFQCYFVGAGIMLIDMTVFERLTEPYFAFSTYESGQVKNGEDGYFCDQVRNKGMEVWCDPTISVGHLGEYEFGELDSE